jgi:hypothetical protein
MKKGEKEKEVYLKVKAWEQSGMSMTSYAKSQGMSVSGFKYWVIAVPLKSKKVL